MRGKHQKIPFHFLYLALIQYIILALFLYFVDPTNNLKFLNIPFSPLIIFFTLLSTTLFSFFYFIFQKTRRAFLASIFILSILILRFFGFRNIFQIIIVFLIIYLIELYISKKTPSKHHHSQP